MQLGSECLRTLQPLHQAGQTVYCHRLHGFSEFFRFQIQYSEHTAI